MRVVLERTVVDDWRFNNLTGSLLESQVNSIVSRCCYTPSPLNMTSQFSHDGIGWRTPVKFVISYWSVWLGMPIFCQIKFFC